MFTREGRDIHVEVPVAPWEAVLGTEPTRRSTKYLRNLLLSNDYWTREAAARHLRRVLRKYRGHMGKVSEHAGLNRRTLYNKLQVHGLRREDFR